MSERDQDRDRKLGSDDLEPGEDEFDEELEGDEEEEEAPEEFEAEAPEPEPAPRRGRREEAAEPARRATGSVRESHERVHVDDRLSAAFVIFAAVVLVGALALALAGNFVPEPPVPTLTPLVVPTAQFTATPSPAATVTAAPTPAPTATPSAAPSAS